MSSIQTIIGDKKILIVRYGKNIVLDCIQNHKKVIDDKGFCWFGKIGRSPSAKVLSDTIHNNGKIILYSSTECFICDCSEYTTKKPITNYPKYYDEYIFNQSKEPSIYFELRSISSIDISELNELVVSSSKNNLLNTLKKSMNSFFTAEIKNNNKTIHKVSKKENEQKNINNNTCKYISNGKCTNKSSVNYKYECLRPNMCIKQTI